jgi:hypothetical protein
MSYEVHMANDTQPATNLGELIDTLYAEFLKLYGDEDLASVATAAAINELRNNGRGRDRPLDESS